jgi:hypothetical protein
VLTSGRSTNVLTALSIAGAAVALLIEHSSSASCMTAGALILTAGAIRFHRKAGEAQYVANQRIGAAAAMVLAGRSEGRDAACRRNNALHLCELIIVQQAPRLILRRRQLTVAAAHGLDDSRWLQEVERFIDDVIEESGCHVRNSPEQLQAVRWMIAGATARFGLPGAIDMASELLQNAA